MGIQIKMLRRRKELTPIDVFQNLQCKPEEFMDKTGHRYAVLVYPNGDCAAIDFDNMPGILLSYSKKMVYVGQTSGAELSRSESNVHKDVYRVILYGYCVNLSEYPVAEFHFQNDANEKFELFVPCYWE